MDLKSTVIEQKTQHINTFVTISKFPDKGLFQNSRFGGSL